MKRLIFFSILMGGFLQAAEVPHHLPTKLPDKKVVGSIVPLPHNSLQIEFPVEKFKLENGLTVLLVEDHSVPLVSYHTWYRVGSRDERVGITGSAHMLEHMMFKGAKKYSGKEFDKKLHENGIVNNAFTTSDYTGFYENLPSSVLEMVMDMEVDRMRFLKLDKQDLLSERQVVSEERRWRVDNNPSGLLRETLMAELYKVHPYTWPVIGYMTDIQKYEVDPLRDFYDRFYVPNNAVLVLVGDFDKQKTKKMIENYYGQLKPVPQQEKNLPKEPAKKMAVRKVVPANVQSQSFVIGYPAVQAGHPDSYALDMLSSVLGGGASSRLYKRLVDQMKVASGVGSYNATSADPGSFFVSVSLKPGITSANAEAAAKEEIQKLINNKISKQELTKVKNQIMKSMVDDLSTLDGKAKALALNEILFGDYSRVFSDLTKYDMVTVDDVQMVAKKYLLDNQRVTAVLVPSTEKK